MKRNVILQKIFAGMLFIFSLTACDPRTLFEKRVTTSIDVVVTNNGTTPKVASGRVQQTVDDDDCSLGFANDTGDHTINSNEKVRLQVSMECKGPVHAWVSIREDVNYDVAVINIYSTSTAAKFTPGLQFRVANLNRSNVLPITVVNSIPNVGSYKERWALSPLGAIQVAWIEEIRTSERLFWQLYIALPKGSSEEDLVVAFDDHLGIKKFGDYYIEHSNGAYRSRIYPMLGTAVSFDKASGKINCDDIGCK